MWESWDTFWKALPKHTQQLWHLIECFGSDLIVGFSCSDYIQKNYTRMKTLGKENVHMPLCRHLLITIKMKKISWAIHHFLCNHQNVPYSISVLLIQLLTQSFCYPTKYLTLHVLTTCAVILYIGGCLVKFHSPPQTSANLKTISMLHLKSLP